MQHVFDVLSTWLLRLLPHRPLARVAWRVTRIRTRPVPTILVRLFVFLYRIDMGEAREPNPSHYPSFNAFFVRALRPGARPIDPTPGAIVSPADAVVSACGTLRGDQILQAKGIDYTSSDLLADADAAALFSGGHFVTLYLSPRDYHRVHMPVEGTLRRMQYVPGDLYSVNTWSTAHVRGLFARNERLVALFDTEAGPLALVMVGAMFVGALETVWTGPLSRRRPFGYWDPGSGEPIQLARGEELGRFNMGSTVILLLPPGRAGWREPLTEGLHVRMGERIGDVLPGDRPGDR